MKHKLIIMAAIAFSITSCEKKNDYKELKEMNWLNGTWTDNYLDRKYTESWQMENDSTYKGHSHIENNKTSSNESISLRQRGDSLYFIVNVDNQNGGEAISFTLTSSADDQYVFENPDHDFPTKIVYKKINNDSIFAEISGKLNGKYRTVDFPMKRKR